MKLLTTVWATVLLSLSVVLIGSGIYAPFNTDISRKERKEGAIACLAFGVPLAAWGGWIVLGLRQDKQQQQRDRLNTAFSKLLDQGDGRITTLAFSMETGLSGKLAKVYLDERAKEFDANFDVDDQGNVNYRFYVGKFDQT
ncbi:hypothetical protein JOY44_16915 [Phormidium sp. CLA17]|uniref:hypothetical protein n=1 Tax=Leptolyngbya sp. Cla-17 TaxID=2803751 RepID=UPI0014932641|nr:hypothetical protein [Leptolyngbya sp. Cla-17]MBM0743273.1 hypothetical protein [Leptolyngbya sp. Cla-17]